jgi:thioredoxin-dependent peroxiredoxin
VTNSATQKLKAGDRAPDFDTVDVNGNSVKLSDIKAKYILVSFLRYSGCPWCNLAIHRLALEHDRLKKHDCEVVAFIQSEKSNILDNIYGRHNPTPPFSIVADHMEHYYDLYGVSTSKAAALRSIIKIPSWVSASYKLGFKQTSVDGDLFVVPASFLIRGDSMIIEQAIYGKSFYDHDMFISLYDTIYFE